VNLNHPSKMALSRVYFDMTADGKPVGRIIMEVRILFIIIYKLAGFSCVARPPFFCLDRVTKLFFNQQLVVFLQVAH
jgi:hypothetical protein